MSLRAFSLLFVLAQLASSAVFSAEPDPQETNKQVPKEPPCPQGSCAQQVEVKGDKPIADPAANTSSNDFSGSNGAPASGGAGVVPKAPNPKDKPPSKNNTKPGCSNPPTKQPVVIATGEKIKDQNDFSGAGLYPASLTRYYHSFGTQIALMFGNNWTSNYDFHLYALGCDHDTTGDFPKTVCIPHTYELDTPNGNFTYTRTSNYVYQVAGSAAMGKIYFNGPGATYEIAGDDWRYDFDASGKIVALTDSNYNSFTFQYNGNQLSSVTSAGNQSIHFSWTGTHVSQVTDPRGQVWNYGYTPAGMLQSVTSPDSHVTTYSYSSINSSWLNGITVDGVQILAVTYYGNGQVASSGTPDGESVDNFAYGSGSTTITNQRGDATTYTFQNIQGGMKLAAVSHKVTSTCPAMAATTAYDTNGWVDYTLDWRGIKTDYTYTPDGRLLDKTLAAGSSTPLKDVYTWTTVTSTGQYVLQSDAAYDSVGNLIKTTTYSYTPSGYLSSVSAKEQASGAVATINYGYTFASNNTLQTRTETRNLPTGTATTTYNYDSSGNLSSVTDPAGSTVNFGGYDGLGRPSTVVAANGASHAFTYDGRGNLATDTASLPNGTAMASFAYDGRNFMVSASMPDGSSYHYTIAQSGRVMAHTDAAGNPASETFTNALTVVESQGRGVASVSGSSVTSSISGSVSSTRQLDSLGRNLAVLGNTGQHFSYGYDVDSNVTSVSDGLHTTSTTYDSLNRPSVITLPDSSTITYGYAPNGSLYSVTTSRGAQTTYTANGFGYVTQRNSPDTGLTTYTVDAFGRVTQEVRSNGTTVSYGYDGLDRLTSRTSNGNTETYTYANSGINAGRLTGISNPTGSSTYTYDGYGHVASQTDVIFGQTLTVAYVYDATGRLHGVTYPDSMSVYYDYNAAGQVTSVTPNRPGGSVSSAVYQPFAKAPYAWAYGNGSTMVSSIDNDGRLTDLNSVFSKNFLYRANNTILSITDATFGDLNETFSYDARDRLTDTSRGARPQTFVFDADGNRTAINDAGIVTSYSIGAGSNKVSSWSYMGGDVYSDGVRTYTRDEFDRLAAVTKGGQTVGQYRYDAFDRRVAKVTAQPTIYYTYSSSGQLLFEYSSQRSVDYVWLADRIVAISINHGPLQAVHSDWLGRPELVTDVTNPTILWRATNAVYDRKVTIDSIGGLNVSFPGQYYDAESDLYYNWHRYYDANSGRYIQSDPAGLIGGINTYSYAQGNPISYVDPFGLWPFGMPGKQDAQAQLPGILTRLVPTLSTPQAQQVSSDSIKLLSWSDISAISSVTPNIATTAPPTSLSSLTPAQLALLIKFLNTLPAADKDAVDKIMAAACPK